MKTIFTFILFLLPVFPMQANLLSNTTRSSNGVICLETNEIITGLLTYHLDKQIITCQTGEQVRTFSPLSVKYFYMNGEGTEKSSYFISMASPMSRYYQRKAFYEVLHYETFTLFRQGKVVRNYSSAKKTPGQSSKDTFVKYTYFVFENGELAEVHDFDRQVLPYLPLESKSVEEFSTRVEEVRSQLQ